MCTPSICSIQRSGACVFAKPFYYKTRSTINKGSGAPLLQDRHYWLNPSWRPYQAAASRPQQFHSWLDAGVTSGATVCLIILETAQADMPSNCFRHQRQVLTTSAFFVFCHSGRFSSWQCIGKQKPTLLPLASGRWV